MHLCPFMLNIVQVSSHEGIPLYIARTLFFAAVSKLTRELLGIVYWTRESDGCTYVLYTPSVEHFTVTCIEAYHWMY